MNVDLLFGPFLIGAFLNIMLYGVLLMQSFIYFRTKRDPEDSPRLRYFVLYLIICDTLNTVFDIGVIYEPLVSRYGTPRATQRIPVMLNVDPIMTVIISVSVQLYYSYRIKLITQSWTIPRFIWIFIFCSLVGGIATTVCSIIIGNYSQLEQFKGAIITWLASSTIADILITASLVIVLIKRRTGNTRTDDMIDRIIRLTIHTGAITALFATLDLVLFVAFPGTSLNFAFDFPLAKLYTNSLLSTLNARSGWDTIARLPSESSVLEMSSFSTSEVGTTRKRYEYVHSRRMTTSPQALVLNVTANRSKATDETQDVKTLDLESIIEFRANDGPMDSGRG